VIPLGLLLVGLVSAAPAGPVPPPHPGAGRSAAAGGIPDTVPLPVITLAEALERAVRLNPDYVRAVGQVGDAEWGRRAARLAFFLPAVTANLDYTKYSTRFFNIGTGSLVSTSVVGRLDARYEILSARKLTELARTQAELDAAQATEAQARFQAALLTESAYYAVLADREFTRVAEDRVARAREQLAAARALVTSGAAVQTDSLQVALELTRALVDLLQQQSSLRVSRLELGRRVGFPGGADAAPLDTMAPAPLPLSVEEAIARAVAQGPEYRTARARERAALAFLRGRRGAYLPTLSLSGAHTRFDDHVFPSARNVSSLTITLNYPLWNNGDREIQLSQARTDLDVARAIRADLERAAARDVTAAYEAYETARARFGLAETALAVARENYRVQETRYRAGATTVLDLLEAQVALTQAQADLVDARFNARLALASLEAMLGARLVPHQGDGS
jgi:outer membrane protein TolC